MRVLGKISHVSKRGNIIARSRSTPPFRAKVFTSEGQLLGKVHDVFGPTKMPYILIKPVRAINSKKIEKRVGENLYIEREWGRKKRKRKK
ncbi:Gar1/Naf1 family protein [Methanothermobacter tenebrarum]|uniref:H/ACA RNA-protein complex protein Gar1 n=1 Tax=Methanothermobacter tenebrarum TaxID=680118 RepID=A0A328PDU6_9EURY|nr:Gar1/Naf1 family protein [Methanothermobacter tenebrarum]NPV64941.1 hypothetical protein [Methanobacteriaceae archaeon]RAO79371.1 hypothetical protein DPC56_03415 [Methanothermobacter tenebrarum]